MRFRIESIINSLDNDFQNFASLPEDETKSIVAKYLCVRCSVLIETYLKLKIEKYIKGSCPQPINKYVNNNFKHFTNASFKKISELLNGFSSDWKEGFESEVGDQLQNSLDSLLNNRHSIAHGNNCNISFSQVKQFYEDVKRIMDIIDTKCFF